MVYKEKYIWCKKTYNKGTMNGQSIRTKDPIYKTEFIGKVGLWKSFWDTNGGKNIYSGGGYSIRTKHMHINHDNSIQIVKIKRKGYIL